MTVLDNTKIFIDSILGSDLVQLESIMKKGNIDYSKYLGKITCVEYAVTRPDILLILVNCPAIDLDRRNMNGSAPVHIACQTGMTFSLDQLLHFGANVEAKDINGQTALHVAAVEGHIDLINILLEYTVAINMQDDQGETALHKAVKGGRPNIVELLIKNGADINAVDKLGRTPLHTAALYNLGYMMLCLTEIGADPKTLDYEGNRPYQLAKDVYLNTTLAMACDFDKQKWDHFNS